MMLRSVQLLAIALAGCSGGDENMGSAGDAAAAMFVPCPESTPSFELGLTATGDADHIRAVLRDAAPLPAKKYANDWTLELTDSHGRALGDAQITQLETFMPVHGHYGRPPAEWDALDGTGKLHAEVHFTMRGPWEVRIEANSESAGADHIVFELCVQE